MIQSGILRHPIRFQRPETARDTAGQESQVYVDAFPTIAVRDLRAAIVPLSGREFVAAKQVHAEITTRITTRYFPEVDATYRILRPLYTGDSPDGEEVYDILAVLPDPVSNRRYLNLMCVLRISEGFRRGE